MPDDAPRWSWSFSTPPHRTHIDARTPIGAPASYVAWCRCDWVSMRCDTYEDADLLAMQHLNEERHDA